MFWWTGTEWEIGSSPVPDCPGPPISGGVVFCGPNSWWISDAGVEGQVLASHGADAPTWENVLFPVAELDTDWQTPDLLNSWVHNGPGFEPVGFRWLHNGTMELKGFVKGGKLGQAIFMLPPDCCPTVQVAQLVVAGPGEARLDITKSGAVMVRWYIGVGSNAGVSLAGCTFAITPTFFGTCRLSGVGSLIGKL